MPLIFQYGSNCSETRLNSPDRLNGNARNPRRVQTVEDYVTAFDVWSHGNGCAASDLRETSSHHAWGVLYDIPCEWIFGRRSDGGRTLQQIEGRCYQPRDIRVRDENGNVIEEPVVTFLVIPNERRDGLWTSFDYVRFIVTGLRAHVLVVLRHPLTLGLFQSLSLKS